MYKHICNYCGQTVEAIGKSTLCKCHCDNIMTNVGLVENDFKRLRLEARLSQSDVARAMGITKSYVSMVENGKVAVTWKLSQKLNKFLLEASEKVG